MTFTQGDLVKYQGKVIGNIAGLFGSLYSKVYTVIGTDEAIQSGDVAFWKWGSWGQHENNPLNSLCKNKYVYNFHVDELQKAQTKLGNVL